MNKKSLYIGVGVLVIVIIAYLIYFNKQKSNNLPASQTSEQQISSTTPPQTTTTPTSTKSNTSKKLSYGDAIKAYPSRFQFINCSANPGSMTIKKGTALMLDNRDKVAHTIKANGQTIKVAALDYAIIYPKLITAGEPTAASPNMTCDGGGSGVLNIEK